MNNENSNSHYHNFIIFFKKSLAGKPLKFKYKFKETRISCMNVVSMLLIFPEGN